MEFAAPVVECFALNAEDALLGDVSWLLYRVSHNLDPTNLAGALELLFQRYIDPAELTINGGEKPFGPRTASWRTLARVAAANTNVPRKVINRARMQMAKTVYRGLLGSCLPAQLTVDKQFDGFRSVAVAASIHLDRVVTPVPRQADVPHARQPKLRAHCVRHERLRAMPEGLAPVSRERVAVHTRPPLPAAKAAGSAATGGDAPTSRAPPHATDPTASGVPDLELGFFGGGRLDKIP
eukprot:jgi/Tetstr1/422912/TSEL_013693.t1